MIFGLIGSTVLTLVVQPVAYMSLETWRKHDFGEHTTDDFVPAAANEPQTSQT